MQSFGALGRQLAIGDGELSKSLFESGLGLVCRHPLELERALQVFGNHLHGWLPGCTVPTSRSPCQTSIDLLRTFLRAYSSAAASSSHLKSERPKIWP